MRERMGRILRRLTMAALLALPLGCEAQPPAYDEAALARETFTAHHPGAVLGGPAATTAAADDTPPWWITRNDGRLNIRPDATARGPEATRVHIRDRQSSSDGRIHNSYRRSVRSSRYQRIQR